MLKWKRFNAAMDHGLEYLLKQYGTPKLIHAHFTLNAGRVALRWKREKGWPYVITEHSTNFTTKQATLKIRILRLLAKAAIQSADHIMPVSQDLADHMQLDPSKSTVIPNVVDKIFFTTKRKRAGFKRTNYLHISSLDEEQKNISAIIDAIALAQRQNQDITLTIVGNMNLEYTRSLIDHSGAAIDLLGPVSYEDIPKIISKHDTLLLWSRYETFSIVIAEAWAEGLNVISSICGGLTNTIKPPMGIAIKQYDTSNLSKAILDNASTSQSIEEEQEIKEYALDRFNEASILQAISGVYKQVISSNE